MAKAYGGITITDTGGIVGQALNSRLKYIWVKMEGIDAGTYAASGNSETFDTGDVLSYGFNSWLSQGALKFRYNGTDLTTIGVGGIELKAPVVQNEQITGSQKSLTITPTALEFYQRNNNDDNDIVITRIGANGIYMNPLGLVSDDEQGFFIENVEVDNVKTIGMGFRTKTPLASVSTVAYNNSLAVGEEAYAGRDTYGQTGTAIGTVWPVQTKAIGKSSFAQGRGAQALHNYSTALGTGVTTGRDNQIVVGRWNEIDNDAVFIIGNGTGHEIEDIWNTEGVEATSGRSNLFVVDTQGNLKIKDGFKIVNETGNYLQLSTDGLKIFAESTSSTASNPEFIDIASFGTETIIKTTDGTELAHFGYDEGQAQSGTAIAPYYTFGIRRSGFVNGNFSFANGKNVIASGFSSHAEGSGAALGYNAHAEGTNTVASGHDSHAEGYASYVTYNSLKGTITSGVMAIGEASHAEGFGGRSSSALIASGDFSHAEGMYTKAQGEASHTQNEGTVATEKNQTVIGMYNSVTREGSGTDVDPFVYTNAGDYAFIIGNGTGDSTTLRSNALTVDWDGNVEAAGTVNGHQTRKTLWSSDTGWNSGSITVPGISKYHSVEITFSGAATHAICFVVLNTEGTIGYVRGSNSYCTTDSIQDYIVNLDLAVSTDTLTWVNCIARITKLSPLALNSVTSLSIARIIGIE